MEIQERYGADIARDLKLLVVLSRCMRAIERRLLTHIRGAGLTPSQFAVMEVIYHKGPVTVNEVIAKTLSSCGNIGVVVNNLMKLGLVEKSVDQSDRRIRHLELTSQGKETMAGYFPEHVKQVQDVFSGLTVTEKDILTTLLKKLGKSI